VRLPYVLALLAGGLVAAPIAAYLVRVIPPQLLGSLVGGFIVLTNSRTLCNAFDITGAAAAATYLTITALWAAAIAWSVRRYRISQRAIHAGDEAVAPVAGERPASTTAPTELAGA
jgi:hypothetical protein